MRPASIGSLKRDGTPSWLYETLHSLVLGQQQTQRGFGAILRGESPDGTGNSLIDTTNFFFKPGLPGGQIGFGSTAADGNLTLSSTSHSNKGFIYLGMTANNRVALDEDNCYFGIGTDTPTARLHLNLATAGTTGNATFGTHFLDATVGQTNYIFSSCAYANGSGVDWAFVVGGTTPGSTVGSVFFVNQPRTVGWRIAFGVYGTDTITYLHHQHGVLDTNPPHLTVNNNALFLGFNDNCGLYETHHFRHFNVWAEGDNLSGSVLSGRTVTAANMAIVGFNSPTTQRTGTTNYDDQPVFTIGGGTWFRSYHGVTLRITTGDSFAGSGGSEGAQAKQEVFQIMEGGSLNSGSNMLFAVDQFARLKLYNPGNGSLTSSLSGRRSLILLEDGVTGASTPSVAFEIHSINAWADGGTAVAAHRIGIGYDDVQTTQPVRNAIFCGNSRVATSEPSLMNRVAFRTSAFYVTDGTFTFNTGQVGAPLGMFNVFNFVSNSKILVALKRKSCQTADMLTNYDSDGSTVLSGFTKDGAYYLVSGAAAGAFLVSDGSGVGSWTSGTSLTLTVKDADFSIVDDGDTSKILKFQVSGVSTATTRTLTVQDASGTLPLLEFANVFTTTQDINPAMDVTALKLHSTNQTPGSLTSNSWEVYNPSGTLVVAQRNSGRLQLGATDTSLDGIVRLSMNCSPTQSVNLVQCTDGTDTLFSIGARGAFVFGVASTGMNAVTRYSVAFSTTQSANVATYIKGGTTIFRMQSNGNLLIGGSSTDAANNGFEKLTVQASSSETSNMVQFTSGLTGATAVVWNLRGVMSTGRIKTAVLFTDDNATVSSAKLLGLNVSLITVGSTRTWDALDLSGTNVIVGNDSPAVAAGSLGKVDLTAQAADITTTNLTNGPPAGDYLVMVYVQCTTADASATLLTVTIGWTDTVGATTDATVTVNMTTTGRASGIIRVKRVSGEITYATTLTGTYNTARYAIDVRVVALG